MPISSPSKAVHISLVRLLAKLSLVPADVVSKPADFSDYFPIAKYAKDGLLNEANAIEEIAKALNIEKLTIDHEAFSAAVNLLDNPSLTKITGADWEAIKAVPVQLVDSNLTVAFANPLDLESQKALEFQTGLRIKTAIASEEHIHCCLIRKLPDIESEFRHLLNNSSEIELSARTHQLESNISGTDKDAAPVIRLVNRILAEGVQAMASDIHISPEREQLEVRIRVDGILRPLLAIPANLQAAVCSRIKLLAGMDIAEKRRPQDGRLRIKTPFGVRDLRLSSIPTANGENIVIRILSSDLAQISFESLGLVGEEQAQLKRTLTGSSRVVLVTGPTGSGKTSSLYASLLHLKNGETNIITIEDPIEYRIAGLTQTQVNTKIGVSFAEGLRAVLRQDPDVVMVGEIRDLETAQIAFQAAQTGHLVMSTLHTNSAAATVLRLKDLGLPSYVIASSLGAVIAQRLVRKLCPKCCIDDDGKRVESYLSLGLEAGQVKTAVGCDSCKGTGYKGRISIFSFLEVTDSVREAIRLDQSEKQIEQNAPNFKSLLNSGVDAINQGLTSIDEVERALGSFELYLRDKPAQQKSIGNQTASGIKKVLLVEDDENIRTVISLLLQNAAYEVIEAENGAEAIKLLHNDKPDIIVSDLMMPKLDGYGVVRHVRSNDNFRKLPILILTAAQTEDNELKLLDIGADDFVGKGADPKILLSRVSRLLSRSA